jgi:hypothetical protein
MSAPNCVLWPEVNGKESKLYKDLYALTNKDRSLTNIIYASYLQPGVAANMDNAGKTKDNLGQHKAEDVISELGIDISKLDSGDVLQRARRYGVIDSNNTPTSFNNAEDALRKADSINSNDKRVVAHVVQQGNEFFVMLNKRDTRTLINEYETQRLLNNWNIVKSTFAQLGMDLDALDFAKDFVNATQVNYFVQWINNLSISSNQYLNSKEIKILLTLNENSIQVQRLKNMFGSIDDITQRIIEYYQNPANYTQGQRSLIDATLNNCKNLRGLNKSALNNAITQSEGLLSTNSDAYRVAETIEDLNAKYNIDIKEISLYNKISKLSEAAANAAILLKRQLKELKKLKGAGDAEVKDLNNQYKRLLMEIDANRFYSGILGFLQNTTTVIQKLEQKINEADAMPGTNLDRAYSIAEAVNHYKKFKEGYAVTLNALENIKSLLIDESLGNVNMDEIENMAKDINSFINKYDNKISNLTDDAILSIAQEYLGNEIDVYTLGNIVKMAETDSTFLDAKFYSGNRVSNPMISMFTRIIRNKQHERDNKLADVALRIRRATDSLYKSGVSNTAWMYDEDGNIISDIDWNSYNEALSKAKKIFYNRGLRGLSYEEAVDDWIEQHTEDRVVDVTNGRTEKVPDSNYRKALNFDSREKEVYYNEMMQIKGELGSLLPNYAQFQYRPPQIRRNTFDAIASGPKGAIKGIKEKLQNLWKIRQDDTDFNKNGIIIEGNEYIKSDAGIDNTTVQQIPIFYVNKLKDQQELLKDFSGALQRLASTAINYSCMTEIQDVSEFIKDYIEDQNIHDKEGEYNTADVIKTNHAIIGKAISKKAKQSNTVALLEGLFDKHFYGVELKDKDKWYSKLTMNILRYTSTKALTANLKGMTANLTMGEFQLIIEAVGHEYFNLADYAWAAGMGFLGSMDSMGEWLSNDKNTLNNLLLQRFNPMADIYGELANTRYHSGLLRRLLSKDLTYAGYQAGEYIIHSTTMYAILHNKKVKINGKSARLFDALYKSEKENGNSELRIKDNTTYIDENGVERLVDEDYLEEVKKQIIECNQTMHGAMNQEDKGLVHQRLAGRVIMNLRQWMVESYSKRFRHEYIDSTGKKRAGFNYTTYKLYRDCMKDLINFNLNISARYNSLTDTQKSNVWRAHAELTLICALIACQLGLGSEEDTKGSWLKRFILYQIKRALLDEISFTYPGVFITGETIINSPVASYNTIYGLGYPIYGAVRGDFNETVKRGKYKGMNKYVRNLIKYDIPYYEQINQAINFGDEDNVFFIFNYY